MTVSFELPEAAEQALRTHGPDLSQAAKEAVLIELYREGRLFHGELAQALGISRYEADGLLKNRAALLDISAEQFQNELTALIELTVTTKGMRP